MTTPRPLAAFLVLVLLSVVLPRTLFHHCDHTSVPGAASDHSAVQADTRCALCEMVVPVYEGRSPIVERPMRVVPVERERPAVAQLRVAPVDRRPARGPPVLG